MASLRSQISMIEQDVFLFSRSIADNIAYGRPGATQAEIEAAARAAQAHDFISKLPDGYQTVVGERGVTLSGGQRQRVAIARALANHPAVIFADEPTASLDSRTADTILDLMKQLNKERGVAFVLSTHDPRVVERAARIITLHDGAIEPEAA
jgi:ATP-binding cassette subfamily B protein